MRTLLTLAMLVPLAACGCGKKPKFTGKSDDTAAAGPTPAVETPKPTEKPKPAETTRPTEKGNWLGDPRFTRKPGPADPELPPDGVPPPNKQPWVGQPAKGGTDAKNPFGPPGGISGPAEQPNPADPPAGGTQLPEKPQPGPKGVLQPQPVPKAELPIPSAGRRVTEADLNDVWTFTDTLSLASGKMPPPNLIYAALVEAKSPAAELVKDGSIILTGAAQREAVWAFERSAPTQGGLIVSQNKVERVTAAEFARRFGR